MNFHNKIGIKVGRKITSAQHEIQMCHFTTSHSAVKCGGLHKDMGSSLQATVRQVEGEGQNVKIFVPPLGPLYSLHSHYAE